MLLEVHFNWSTADLALGQGLAYLGAAPLFLPLLGLSDVRGPLVLNALAIAGAVSLTVAGELIPGPYVPTVVLAITAVIYVLVASGMSLFFAAAGNASLPGTIFSKDNLIIITYVDGSFALVVAMVSRHSISTGGLVGYVVSLSAFLLLQCIFALIMAMLFSKKRRTASAAFPLQAELCLLQG